MVCCLFITYTEDKALDSTLSSLYREPDTRHHQWTYAPRAAVSEVCSSLERQVLPPHFLVVLQLGNRPTKAHLSFLQDVGAVT